MPRSLVSVLLALVAGLEAWVRFLDALVWFSLAPVSGLLLVVESLTAIPPWDELVFSYLPQFPPLLLFIIFTANRPLPQLAPLLLYG